MYGKLIDNNLLHIIPEYAEIDNELIKECPICLETTGLLIETGCMVCRNNNSKIHQQCLNELKNSNFHITHCYICKTPLENNNISDNNISDNNAIYKIQTYGCLILLLFFSGFVGKLIVYPLLYYVYSKKDADYFIMNNINPFANYFNFILHMFCIFIVICITYYIKLIYNLFRIYY